MQRAPRYLDEEGVVLDWAFKNRCTNDDGPMSGTGWDAAWTDEELALYSLTNSIGSTGADLTVENLLAAQQALLDPRTNEV